ncbi:sigma-70 family RNA polymerase sigma factor [Dawidia soli]|uniref:Sigma-70 family RNA polymerase sigma factor n=1 Tax=Dawidia soli TaxID=2782352 RepID=A0AAP2D6E6_9BACT|nr:sigma-70 family RNA polymerase sigma factor [Dawidia soli]MBT1686178.1 sigma-70 family RNA polymerase sigma factor [Dawidia soli]
MEVAEIYTHFRQSLFAYIRSKTRSKEDAEDIFQEVFMKISNNVDKISHEDKLPNWIFRTTRNAIIDYYRAKAATPNVPLDDTATTDKPIEEDIDSTQGLDRCMGCMIRLLPEEYKDILIDAELNGIRQKELAEKYDMPYPTLRSRVQRGRERLKQLFYNCCHIEADSRGNILEAHGRADYHNPCHNCISNQQK